MNLDNIYLYFAGLIMFILVVVERTVDMPRTTLFLILAILVYLLTYVLLKLFRTKSAEISVMSEMMSVYTRHGYRCLLVLAFIALEMPESIRFIKLVYLVCCTLTSALLFSIITSPTLKSVFGSGERYFLIIINIIPLYLSFYRFLG